MEEKWVCITWMLIISSALLGALPFLLPYFFAECVFIFLIPLYYLILKNDHQLSFKEGFIWGLLFYSFYFHGLVVLIIQHGAGSYRLLAGFALILYGAFGSGLWFFCASRLQSVANNIRFVRATCWVVTSFMYFWLLDTNFFSVFGIQEGDQLRFLTLPLAIRPHWLLLSNVITRYGSLLLIIVFSMSCAYFFIRPKKRLLLVLCGCFLPFAAGWLLRSADDEPPFLSTIVCIIPSMEQIDPWLVHEHLCDLLQKSTHYKDIRYIFMPESSFQFPLNQWQRFISSWYDCLGHDSTYLILGGHRQDEKNLFNTLYVLHDRRIIHYYDKIHGMFFTERIPTSWSYATKNLFLKNKTPFCQAIGKRAAFFLPVIGNVYPYLCSDLFFEPYQARSSTTNTVVCLVNDSWFYGSYIPELMFLHAVSKAIYEHCTVIYVSYYNHEHIASTGYSRKLLTIS